MKRKTRLEFSGKLDLMMSLVVKWGLAGGACGKRWGDRKENEKQLSGKCHVSDVISRFIKKRER
jgi:hypothetical protein